MKGTKLITSGLHWRNTAERENKGPRQYRGQAPPVVWSTGEAFGSGRNYLTGRWNQGATFLKAQQFLRARFRISFFVLTGNFQRCCSLRRLNYATEGSEGVISSVKLSRLDDVIVKMA